jgi:endonuclease YncB( thermonuclease family)
MPKSLALAILVTFSLNSGAGDLIYRCGSASFSDSKCGEDARVIDIKHDTIKTIQGNVINVSDGDTLTVVTADNKYKIRLARIDAPEISHFGKPAQPFGKEAGAHLRKILNDKVVNVDIEAIDHYGRSVGTVYLNHQNVNLTMVEDGYAWVYREYSNGGDDLMMLEKEARRKRIGLWMLDDPIYPSTFRKAHK